MSKIKTLCSCKAGGTGDAAGQGRTEAAPSSRAQTCPSPGRIPSPQGAPDRDRSCRNRKAAQPPGTEELLQSTPFLRPSGRPVPHSARLIPEAIRSRPQSSEAVKPARGAMCQGWESLLPKSHTVHMQTYTFTQTHCIHKHTCTCKCTSSALWAGLECGGLKPQTILPLCEWQSWGPHLVGTKPSSSFSCVS